MRTPAAIDVLLEESRRGMDRVHPAALASELTAGALVIDRNVLEWRLDPTCPHHIPQVSSADVRIIVVCNEGYSSSLAAATLRQLGLLLATDLIGGFQGWKQFCADSTHSQ